MTFDPDSYPLPIPEENYYDKEEADQAVNFYENLRHIEGKWAGQTIDLMKWQEDRLIRPLFGLKRPDGTRQYRTAYCEIPRKNGKSLLGSGTANKLLFADGENGPQVYGAAYDRDQASIVFDVALKMVQKCDSLNDRADPTPYKKEIKYPAKDGKYKAISKETKKSHGYNPHGIIFDELHTQRTREMWDTLDTAFGAREQPLMFVITTAGFRRESICREQHDYAKKVLDGEVHDPSFFSLIFSAEEYIEDNEEASWDDTMAWYIANPSLELPDDDKADEIIEVVEKYTGIRREPGTGFRSLDKLKEDAQKARHQTGFRNTFKRLYLNIWTHSETSFIDPDDWASCASEYGPDLLEGMTCYGGLDLASKEDLTALVLVFGKSEEESEDVWVWPYLWVPEDTIEKRSRDEGIPYNVWHEEGDIIGTPGNVIDQEAIEYTIKDCHDTFGIKQIAFDDWGAEYISQQIAKVGIEAVPTRQGTKSMNEPTRELEVKILKGTLHHPDNQCLNWMMRNLVVEENATGFIKPSKRKSDEKIDGAVALIMAIDRLIRNEGTQEFKSVYEDRGVVVL